MEKTTLGIAAVAPAEATDSGNVREGKVKEAVLARAD